MTLPPVSRDTRGTLQFEWSGIGYLDLGPRKRASATGSGYMIEGAVTDPCRVGQPHGFRHFPWDTFPVIVPFPDVANDPFFAGTSRMGISVSVSSFFFGPSAISIAAPCTTVITTYPASMHMYLALGSADGPIAQDINGEPFEFVFNGREWVGHEYKWFLDTYMEAYAVEVPVIGSLPRYVLVIDSGFFGNYYPQLGIAVNASTEGPLPPFVPPDPPPVPPSEIPPMPGCDAGGTPTTVSAGPHSGGVVPMQP